MAKLGHHRFKTFSQLCCLIHHKLNVCSGFHSGLASPRGHDAIIEAFSNFTYYLFLFDLYFFSLFLFGYQGKRSYGF